MARTWAQIQKQIAQLQKEAESIKSKELDGVIGRIKEAVEHYGLTTKDIFGAAAGSAPRVARKTRGRKAGAKKSPLPPKFRDEAGNAWSGHGKRPNWYKAAIAAGKSPEDLMIR
jgi:DNA-binding protein H-NS